MIQHVLYSLGLFEWRTTTIVTARGIVCLNKYRIDADQKLRDFSNELELNTMEWIKRIMLKNCRPLWWSQSICLFVFINHEMARPRRATEEMRILKLKSQSYVQLSYRFERCDCYNYDSVHKSYKWSISLVPINWTDWPVEIYSSSVRSKCNCHSPIECCLHFFINKDSFSSLHSLKHP
jgi:hypothetical protein